MSGKLFLSCLSISLFPPALFRSPHILRAATILPMASASMTTSAAAEDNLCQVNYRNDMKFCRRNAEEANRQMSVLRPAIA